MATLNLGKVVGNTGPAGPGVAPGGSSGQVLAKKTDSDYDTEWINPPSGSGGSVAVDATLTKSGQAADAKATGDAIAAEKKARVESVNQLSEQIGDCLKSDPAEDESTEAPEMGSVPINADQLGGKTYQQVLDAAENQVMQKADTMVIEGSSALVTSGAVYSALHAQSDFVPLTMANGAYVEEPGNSYYVVRNGMCFVNLAGLRVSQEGAGKDIVVNLPKAAMRSNTQFTLAGSETSYPIVYIDGLATSLKSTVPITNIYINLQYPVASE